MKLKRFFKLKLPAGSALFENSSIGPILSPFMSKDKINNFCNEFNRVSLLYKKNLILQVKLNLYTDNSFLFTIKGPVFSDLIKIIYDINKYTTDVKLELADLFFIIYLKNLFFIINNKNTIQLKKQLIMSINSISNLNVLNK